MEWMEGDEDGSEITKLGLWQIHERFAACWKGNTLKPCSAPIQKEIICF